MAVDGLLDGQRRLDAVTALHLLLGRLHVAEAGGTPLSPYDEMTLHMVCEWRDRVGPKLISMEYVCKCPKLAGCPHPH